jgi:iron(III) transport system substrate-binding protein
MTPWIGEKTPKVGLIATGTDSPNAARLFLYFMLTADGAAPQIADGKVSTNTTVAFPADDAAQVGDHWDKLFSADSSTSGQDYANLADWQDFWTISSR